MGGPTGIGDRITATSNKVRAFTNSPVGRFVPKSVRDKVDQGALMAKSAVGTFSQTLNAAKSAASLRFGDAMDFAGSAFGQSKDLASSATKLGLGFSGVG